MQLFGKMWFLLWSVIVCLLIAEKIDDDNPLRMVKQGQLKGKMMTSDEGKPFEAYLGIPFGKVAKRFMSPDPADSWNGIHDATKDGPACKQFNLKFQKIYGEENCLTLNVYTPKSSKTTELLPVMVFIYGGRFTTGEASSTMYGPIKLMNYPIVLVLMNYRIGGLGFLSTGDEAAFGNFGLLDQVLALQWVKDNIAAFGGDPRKVTISGHSAGGSSVAFHLLSPISTGLFHAAIVQSGSALRPSSIQKQPLTLTKTIAKKLNCTTSSHNEMVECLRKVNVEDLIRVENETSLGIVSSSQSFGPVVEHANGGKFLTEEPLKLMKEGRLHKVPIISGVLSYEATLFISELHKLGVLLVPKDITDKNLDIVIANLVRIDQLENKTDPQDIKEAYFTDVDFGNIADVMLREIDLSSDFSFKSCNDKMVKLLSSSGTPVYVYVIDHAPRGMSATNYSGKPDTYHGMELEFLFNYTDFEFVKTTSDDARIFGKLITDLWTNFVIFGNPTPTGPVRWTPTPPGAIRYLNIAENMTMVDGYRTEEMQFWDDHLYDVNEE